MTREARAALLEHLDALSAAGHPAVCWTVPLTDRAVWTSDDATDQQHAANLCGPCPALTACRTYGLAHPKEAGVIGGLTEPQRRRGARKETNR
ncbi:WhiB family transcriptional regulator [Actinotalea sp. BY-33]|uniref:WhiB family transcriptional regulator n=1 Tax=Actinotalea soli TaxID=2819234 RepID=A0A939RVK6_9CELL|nr:WhiB family transcriptional regulator [Actinotalea soli]MBO1751718.1 WhiB family transcriptional regulator [Actinotalea soli]